jgi:tetratricopeptide (TPR) repeat protein
MSCWSSLRLPGFAAVLLAVCLPLWGRQSDSPARNHNAKLPALAPEQQAKLKERDRLLDQIEQLLDRGKLEEAARLIEKEIALAKGVFGEAHEVVARDQAFLAQIHQERGDWPAARTASVAVLTTCTRLYGPNHWRVTDARRALRDLDRLAKLTPAEQADLALARRLKTQGLSFYAKAKYAEAKKLFQQTLDIHKRILGEEHSDTGTSYNNLALAVRGQGQYAAAEKLHRQALAIDLKVLGEEHPDTAICYNNLAADLSAQGGAFLHAADKTSALSSRAV